MKLDFLGIVLLVFYAGLALVAYRLAWWLATASERLIGLLTQLGATRAAKLVLAILIGYNAHTYQRSRFMFRNQARVRFALLWGSFILLAVVLLLFQQLRAIGSVGVSWLGCFAAYVGFRILMYWTRSGTPAIYTEDPLLKSLIQDVNEQSPRHRQSGQRIIRQYDYLDELFAHST